MKGKTHSKKVKHHNLDHIGDINKMVYNRFTSGFSTSFRFVKGIQVFQNFIEYFPVTQNEIIIIVVGKKWQMSKHE